MSGVLNFGPYSFEAGNLDKLMYPEAGYTQGDVLEYYQDVAELLLPHLEDRPVSLQRFPDGIQQSGFYQKQAPDYFPDWITRGEVEVEESGETQQQVVVDKAATLAYLVDQGCLTLHTWLSRLGHLRQPDQLIFDLDPPEGDFESVRTGALDLQALFQDLELAPYVKTTGSKGLHVVVPLEASADFDEVRQFARQVCELLARRQPERYTIEMRKADRKGRLFLDYLRNSYAQTSVAPYCLRPIEGAPVAAPLDWAEVRDRDLHSQSYTLANIRRRLGQKDDPWADMRRHARSLDGPRRALYELRQPDESGEG